MKAIFLHGPSGVGKSELARIICKKHKYKHCDVDSFYSIFSEKRSKERSEICSKVGYEYALELIRRKIPLVVEGLQEMHTRKLKSYLKKHKYKVTEISLKASKEVCIKRDSNRGKPFGKKVIQEVHSKYSKEKGIVVDVSCLSPLQTYNVINKSGTGEI